MTQSYNTKLYYQFCGEVCNFMTDSVDDGVWDQIPVEVDSCVRLDWLSSTPTIMHRGYRDFPVGKAAG
jgi:hypothetical protein